MSNHRYRDLTTNDNYEERSSFPADQGATEPRKRTGVVTNAKIVKLREEANYESKVLTLLKEGTSVDILDNGIKTNGFNRVNVNGIKKSGFIASDFCEEEK